MNLMRLKILVYHAHKSHGKEINWKTTTSMKGTILSFVTICILEFIRDCAYN